MRLCLPTTTFLPKVGGTQICVDQLARKFSDRGHEVVVVAPYTDGPGANLQGDYPVARYRRPWSQRGWYWGLKRLLARLHRAHRFDLINYHEAYPGAYVGGWFRRRFNVPLVITPHGEGVFYRSRLRKKPDVWRRIQRGLADADAVIALSGYFAALLNEIAPAQRNLVRIGNGVNNRDFEQPVALSAKHQAACGRRFLLALGRVVERKGFDTAVTAFAHLPHRDPDLRLVIAGDGPDRARLEQLSRDLGIAGRVVFLGTVVGPEKVALLQHCLFTLTPSVEEDNMPLVLLEALSCGKPVVGSRLGGIPDVIVPGRNGELCIPGNANDFAAAMARMLHHPHPGQLTAAALHTARHLDWERVADEYVALFERLLAARRSHVRHAA